MYRIRRLLVVLMLLTGLVAGGCLPIELSASKDGKILIPRQEGFCILELKKDDAATKVVYAPKSDKPAMGLFAPDGKSFLAISQTSGGGMGTAFKVEVVQIADAKAKALLTLTNLTYARWSPDGKHVTLTRLGDQKSAALDKNMPELILVDTAAGEKKKLGSDVSIIHRWFPDSKHVLTLQIASKAKDKDEYSGKLVKIDISTGKAEPLASVLSGSKIFLDLSPDGGKVLFTAIKATKAATQPAPMTKPAKPQLYELDIKSGAIRVVKGDVAYAIYSPKGTKVLVGAESEQDGTISLAVGDAALKKFETVATDAAKSSGGTGGSDIYPGWFDDDSVYYISMHTVFGTSAKNYHLTMVSADGKQSANLQPVIDAGLMEK